MSSHRRARILALTAALGVLSACSDGASGRGEAEIESEIESRTRHVTVEGGQLYVRCIGSGDPLVVVHGGPSTGHRYLVPQLRPLTEHHRLVFYDQRGVGRSTGLPVGPRDSARVDFRTFVHDLETLRRALKLEELNLLGHSWGGLLAMGYAVTHPQRVDRLVLLSATEPGNRYAEPLRETLERRTTAADSAERARLFRSPGFRTGRVAVVDSLFRNTFRPWLGDPSLADRLSFGLDRAAAESGRRAGRLATRNIGSVVSWAELPSIRAQTLIIHGERDPIPTAMARELETRIPDARLVILPEAGHFPVLESPDTALRSILDFLAVRRSDDALKN